MITLTNWYRKDNGGTNSKGNQLKFKKDGIWYKADGVETGSEGLSETVVSNILSCSNCSCYTEYKEEEISYENKVYLGCKSQNFINDSCETLVTSNRIAIQFYEKGLKSLLRLQGTKNKIEAFVGYMSKATGIDEVALGVALTEMLEIDAYTLNNDRHFNNIAFIYNEKSKAYSLAPIFDNGAAFMTSDPSYQDKAYVDTIEARPFSRDFNKQKEAAEELFGKQLKITLSDFNLIMPIQSIYPIEEKIAVMDIIKTQSKKYYGDIVDIADEELLSKTIDSIRDELCEQLNQRKELITASEAKNMFGRDERFITGNDIKQRTNSLSGLK